MFPTQHWSDAAVASGAFHEVAIGADVVARIASGPHHHDRSIREWQIATQISDLFVTFPVPRPVTTVRSDSVRSGYLLTRLPQSEKPSSDWARVRSSYEALLGLLHDAPVTAQLPAARSWCGGDLMRVLDEELTDLLGDDAQAAIRAVATVEGLPGTTPVLVHGDFGPHNIIWRDGVAGALIDWDHACIDDPAIDIAPLIGAYGSAQVRQIVTDDVLGRAMVHRATLPLQVAVAAHNVGRRALRDHALGNFRSRLHAGVLYDPDGAHP